MKEFRSNYEGWPTTRRYPRTLAEAFPNDPENYVWFHKPTRERGKLELTMLGADLGGIKEDKHYRADVKSKVDAILKKFEW